jgi:hypothetical protein
MLVVDMGRIRAWVASGFLNTGSCPHPDRMLEARVCVAWCPERTAPRSLREAPNPFDALTAVTSTGAELSLPSSSQARLSACTRS